MNDSDSKSSAAAQLAKPKSTIVSERKLKANRKNAKKSTGPKTSRGKSYSRRNSRKHGLFIRDKEDFFAGGDAWDFETYYKRLLDELQPIGPCEETEVEYIATCWIRLQRLWRYENAEIESGTISVQNEEDKELCYDPLSRATFRCTRLTLLVNAEKQAEVNGHVSSEWRERIFEEDPFLRFSWPVFEAEAEQTAQKKRHDIAIRIAEERQLPLSEAKALLVLDPKSLPERERFVFAETVRSAIKHYASKWQDFASRELQNDYRRQVIPDSNSVDKIIRYANTFERQLSRSYDRLERLQRRRRGEPVPPPVSVHLTQ
jgi:hypothetical protein